MSAEKVVEKILADAADEAAKIKAQAQEKTSAEKAEFDAAFADFNKETADLADAAGQDKERRILATARMDIAGETLKIKKQLLDDVFVQAFEEIKRMDNDKYLALTEKLIGTASETGDEEVLVGKNESRINSDFIKNLNGKLSSKLTLAETKANIEGGFILRRGKIKINVSLKVLLAQAKEELETKLATELLN